MEKHFCANEALILNGIWQIAIFENRAEFVSFSTFWPQKSTKTQETTP